MEGEVGIQVVRSDRKEMPSLKWQERLGMYVKKDLREIRKAGKELELAGMDKSLVEGLEAVALATQKVVRVCTDNELLGRAFMLKYDTTDRDFVRERSEQAWGKQLRKPGAVLRNFKQVIESGAKPEDYQQWFLTQGMENLVDWIVTAGELAPPLVENMAVDIGYKRFGIEGEMKVEMKRPEVLQGIAEREYKNVEGAELSLGAAKLKREVETQLGKEWADRIWLCGGTARDIVQGKDPTVDIYGDLDYGFEGGDEDTPMEIREKTAEIIKANSSAAGDELTGPNQPFRRAMRQAGAVTLKDMLWIDREFSINKFAVNLGTGEIYDPHGGVKDLAEGRLRLVGENIGDLTKNEMRSKDLRMGEGMILALRGARFASQYGLEIDPQTAKTFHESLNKNEMGNRWVMQFKGPDGAIFLSDMAKGYVKMIEKAQNGKAMLINMKRMGILGMFSQTIDVLNFQHRQTWGPKLRELKQYYQADDYEEFLQEARVAADPYHDEDVRTEGYFERGEKGLKNFVGGVLALGRMANYLVYGV